MKTYYDYNGKELFTLIHSLPDRLYDQRGNLIVVSDNWTLDDVIDCFNNSFENIDELSFDETIQALELVAHGTTTGTGISWNTIEDAIQQTIDQR